MPIANIIQQDILQVDDTLRLRKFDGDFLFALSWYQDEETVKLVDGKNDIYDMDKLERMYQYLNNIGELYWIEIMNENGQYQPIGDVTFWKDDMPIVIGDQRYRGQGIGKKIVAKLIERAIKLGYEYICVNEIYSFNIGSQKLFESVGCRKCGETPNGFRYRLDLDGGKKWDEGEITMDGIQELLNNYSNEINTLFTELRKFIYESVTDENVNQIDEKLWAKLPSYNIGEKFVRLLPFKDHINVEAEAILKHKAELEQFKITPKGMLQIYPIQDLPCDALKAIFSETLLG